VISVAIDTDNFYGDPMDNWTFGWTLALVGMGGTMLVLWCLSLLILLLKKLFPYQPEESPSQKR
jgi:hypothetical protein